MTSAGLVGDGQALELADLRRLALAYLALAGKDRFGRRHGDPIFDAVTEGRQTTKYSSCADVAHWLLYRLGFREAWINRAEHKGWRVALNLRLLTAAAVGGANELAVKAEPGMVVEPGDILVSHVSDPQRSHVIVVCSTAALIAGATLVCVEYGQFDDKYRRACGRCTVRSLLSPVENVDSVLSLAVLFRELAVVPAEVPRDYLTGLLDRLPVLDRGAAGLTVRWWLETLLEHRLDPGTPLDRFGPKAKVASAQFRAMHGLGPDADWSECWQAAIAYEGPSL